MSKTRTSKGQSLVELPAGMLLLLVAFAFPLMALASFSYRASLLYFATRDTCAKAAKAQSFTLANTAASASWSNDLGAWTGMTGTESLLVVACPTPTGLAAGKTQQTFSTPAAVNTFMTATGYNSNNYIYLMNLTAQTSLNPLLPVGSSWMGFSIPGLNAPYSLTSGYQTYIENPTGMKN
jgi:hypothetical protein